MFVGFVVSSPKFVHVLFLPIEPFKTCGFAFPSLRQDGHDTINESGGRCYVHGKVCSLPRMQLDLLVAGFSCKSNSLQCLGHGF